MLNLKNKKAVIFLLLFLLLFSLISILIIQNVYAETDLNFDNTDILDDLKEIKKDDKTFNINDYPANKNGYLQIISFFEICYPKGYKNIEDYGLYIYIYNPKNLDIDVTAKANKIQLAIAFDYDGKATNYDKFDLTFCSVTKGSYDKLIYKFKINEKHLPRIFDIQRYVENNGSEKCRNYSVSGIELLDGFNYNATEYKVGCTYKYSGYAKGYGIDENSPSTIVCKFENLDVCEVKLNHTFFRTSTSNKGLYHQNQLDSVYFAVDNEFFKKYGSLQKIKCEWYEYKTAPIIVTSDQNLYNKVYDRLGEQVVTNGYNGDIGFGLYANYIETWNQDVQIADWGWNGFGRVTASKHYEYLNYIFKVDNIKAYDPLNDKRVVGGVKSNALIQYIMNYDKSYIKGRLPIKNGNVSADLFLDTVDSGRTRGKNTYEFDADVDILNMLSYARTNPNFWDKQKNLGFWKAVFNGTLVDDSFTGIEPMCFLEDVDFNGIAKDVAKKLLIQELEVSDLWSFYKQAEKEDKKVVLLRFATTDYYAPELSAVERKTIGADKVYSNIAYGAQETVFLDFDVIQLTFRSVTADTVIPVVASPIDAVGDITPSPDFGKNKSLWDKLKEVIKIMLYIVAIVLVLVLIFPFLPTILSFLAWLLKAIIKIIVMPFKAIKKLIKKE